MLVHRFGIGLALAVAFAWSVCGGLRAADTDAQKKPEKSKAEQKDDAKKDDAEDETKGEANDPYKLPEGDVKELLAFMKEVQARRLDLRKTFAAMTAAVEKIQQIATDDDKKLDGYDDAMAFLLVQRASSAANRSPAEAKQLAEDLQTAVVASETSPPRPAFFAFSRSKYIVAAANQLCISLEYSPRPELKEIATDCYRTLGTTLSRSKDPQTAKAGAKMEGAVRRLNLVGQPLELSGTEMDGTKFDWTEYRGKVVLVDFWATWCGPCRAELPNVKKNYRLYRDRGFEVVGVSLDRDRDKLEEFLEKEKIRWLTLYDGEWNDNAVATYYGVMGIPTVMLVDKEGKVVSTDARGQKLAELLETLIGPAEAAEDEKSDTQKPDTKGSDDSAAK